METLRTPDARFENLPGFPFAPHYAEIPDGEGGALRVHYLDEGRREAAPVLLMHGEPSWCFLYRKTIQILVQAGHRVIAPDLVGFGRSDKPASPTDYTYARHVAWMRVALLDALALGDLTLVGQDWGALIGLRLVAEHPDRFRRVAVANGFLPTGDETLPEAFFRWQRFSQRAREFDVGRVIRNGTVAPLAPEVAAAYDAPFPDDRYKAGARIFPSLVPTRPDDPASEANRRAWEALRRWERPFLTAFSDSDPIMAGAERPFQEQVPGAKGQPHVIIRGAGHFLQEDRGEELGRVIADWLAVPHAPSPR